MLIFLTTLLASGESLAIDPSSSRVARTSKAVLLIRALVGWVFLSEGIQNLFVP